MIKSPETTPYAMDKDAQGLFVKLKYSGIHELVVFCDGISITYFDGDVPYLKVVDVVEWHTHELEVSHGVSGNKGVLAALQDALRKFADGKIEET